MAVLVWKGVVVGDFVVALNVCVTVVVTGNVVVMVVGTETVVVTVDVFHAVVVAVTVSAGACLQAENPVNMTKQINTTSRLVILNVFIIIQCSFYIIYQNLINGVGIYLKTIYIYSFIVAELTRYKQKQFSKKLCFYSFTIS